MKAFELRGQRFGALTAKFPLRKRARDGSVVWVCRCTCGRRYTQTTAILRAGGAQSCGCLRDALIGRANSTHGETGSLEYVSWSSMIARCCNPNAHAFHRYGGRGIQVCTRWRQSFKMFLRDMGRRPTRTHQLERKNNNGPYAPHNCVWATRKQQAHNRSTNHMLTFRGQTLPLIVWARKLGLSKSTLRNRIVTHRWPVAKALTLPARKKAA